MERFTDISDEELDSAIQNILDYTKSGETYVIGSLLGIIIWFFLNFQLNFIWPVTVKIHVV